VVFNYGVGGEDSGMMDRLRVGVIGANLQGSWGVWAHLPALAALDGIAASAVATSRMVSAEETAKAFGIARAFDDPRALAESPDVDVVAICVRVPAHRELVTIALEAGKHVYCEWPLGRDTAEAEALAALAEARGIIHMIGLQARQSPVLRYARDLIAEGAIGAVRSAALTHSVDWISQPYPSMAYLHDRSSGAHFLSIPGGHSIDALCWLLGEFDTLSATVKTALTALQVVGTGDTLARTSADQIVVQGELAGGIVASVRLSGASSPGTGISLEISGDKGDLVVSAMPGERGIQMSALRLQKTVGMAELVDVEVPERYHRAPQAIRQGPPLNVAEAYLSLADAIRGKGVVPGFREAVERHATLDRIEQSARTGRRL
jgi:predicted dehydrogenase